MDLESLHNFESILKYIKTQLGDLYSNTAVTELLDDDILLNACDVSNQIELCVIIFVPDIYDTMAIGRSKFIEMFKTVGNKLLKSLVVGVR